MPKKTFVEIPRSSRLVLGQKRDSSGLAFDASQSFSGRVADLSLWRGELVQDEIQSLARCERISTRGIVLDWEVDDYERSDVRVEEVQGELQMSTQHAD